MDKFTSLKKAVVYDRINKFGGAERVLLSLSEIMGPKLYTLVHDRKKSKWANKFDIRASFFNIIPLLRDKHELLTPLACLGFENFKFDDYDLVLSVTSSDAKAIITKPETLHVCYCLTPPRYLWEMDQFYRKRPGFGKLSGFVSHIFSRLLTYLRETDIVTSSRPDVYIAISNEVKKRIKKIYKRDAFIVYPPVDFEYFSALPRRPEDYYLVVSRLVPYKKISLAVKAFNVLGIRLVVVGSGSEMDRLRKMANNNIEFVGQIEDGKLREYYSRAKALIFPQLEDFGITPLEAQAAGTPVIAYGRGGALETIVNNKTGLFFETQSSGAIMNAVKRFEKNSFNEADCRENAKKFDKKEFIKNFLSVLNTL